MKLFLLGMLTFLLFACAYLIGFNRGFDYGWANGVIDCVTATQNGAASHDREIRHNPVGI